MSEADKMARKGIRAIAALSSYTSNRAAFACRTCDCQIGDKVKGMHSSTFLNSSCTSLSQRREQAKVKKFINFVYLAQGT